MSNVKQYTITIFGDRYHLMSDESEEAIHNAASFIDTMMKEIAEKTKLQDSKKVAVLAALRTASLLKSLEIERELTRNHYQKLADCIDQELLSL